MLWQQRRRSKDWLLLLVVFELLFCTGNADMGGLLVTTNSIQPSIALSLSLTIAKNLNKELLLSRKRERERALAIERHYELHFLHKFFCCVKYSNLAVKRNKKVS